VDPEVASDPTRAAEARRLDRSSPDRGWCVMMENQHRAAGERGSVVERGPPADRRRQDGRLRRIGRLDPADGALGRRGAAVRVFTGADVLPGQPLVLFGAVPDVSQPPLPDGRHDVRRHRHRHPEPRGRTPLRTARFRSAAAASSRVPGTRRCRVSAAPAVGSSAPSCCRRSSRRARSARRRRTAARRRPSWETLFGVARLADAATVPATFG
jgi:hypothetical protein